jgi:hypothetical protein
MNKNAKLFIVEFGSPDIGGGSLLGFFGSQKPLYVVATSYDEAAKKALIYVEAKNAELEEDKPKSVVAPDGSLRLNYDDEIELKVKAVRLACDEIVW